jgi:hypothetical protein
MNARSRDRLDDRRRELGAGRQRSMISDLDIWRSANELIKQFGDTADNEAATRAEGLLDEGDLENQRDMAKDLNRRR